MKTTFDTLKGLARNIVDGMAQEKLIIFEVDNREDLIECLAKELNVSFSTDEDIRDQAIEEVEEKMGDASTYEDITETEMFNHARKEIIKGFQGEVVGGLYMVESLNKVANRIVKFIMYTDLVDDVFAVDEELIEFLVKQIRQFAK